MKINIQTSIRTDRDLVEVFSMFNKEMFYFLTKNAPVEPVRYDGDFVGAEIHLQMNLPWKDDWISIITEKSVKTDVCFFVDEGKKLPFNILEWRHSHIVRRSDLDIIIEDDIYFKSINWVFDLFWWLVFIPQFLIRKSQYKKYFKRKFSREDQ